MNQKLCDATIRATKETFASLGMGSVNAAAPVEKKIDNTHKEVSVVIGFAGEINGAFVLKCPRTLAVGCAKAMLGMDVEADSADMKDAVGELVNMIAGNAKGLYSNTLEAFKITVPTTIVGGDYQVHLPVDAKDSVASIEFTSDSGAFAMEVFVKE